LITGLSPRRAISVFRFREKVVLVFGAIVFAVTLGPAPTSGAPMQLIWR
jgi:hypothetical protein